MAIGPEPLGKRPADQIFVIDNEYAADGHRRKV
jgi:hypothetical protein